MKNKNLIIIPVSNNASELTKTLQEILSLSGFDILIIDDASEDRSLEIAESYEGITVIKKELEMGYGASFISGCEYASHIGYETAVFLDPANQSPREDIAVLMDSINYGYDIVSASRFIDGNFFANINTQTSEIISTISGALSDVNSSINTSDPLSSTLALKIEAIKLLELTDYTHGVLLQMWIQAAHYKLTITEIPSNSTDNSASEIDIYEEPVNMFLSIIETEKYLFPGGSVN